MNFATLLSVALVMLVGFAAHRASLCTVKAVAEILTSGTAYMLSSFAKAAAWATAVSGTILLFTSAAGAPVLERAPHAFALAGGFMFGVGAAVNGGCSLSTLQRLADGDLTMLGTLAGFIVGVLGWSLLDQRLGLTVLHTQPSFWRAAQGWILPLLTVLWLWALREIARQWHPHNTAERLRHRLAARTYRFSSAAAVLGIAGGLLYTLQGAWTYTNFLRTEAISWLHTVPPPAVAHGFLFAALLSGMLFSSLQRRSFVLQYDWRTHLGRRLGGGFLMGAGGALVPGGNDTLILAAIPTLSPWALGTYLTLLSGVAIALIAMRALTGSLARVECTDDRCA